MDLLRVWRDQAEIHWATRWWDSPP